MSQTEVSPSPVLTPVPAGMGVLVLDEGCAFRVWAPHADAVSVVGSFNDWNPAADPLDSEGNGHWAVVVAAAKPGDQYGFVVRRGDESFSRPDPRARKMTHSSGSSVIWRADPAAKGPEFTPPTLDQAVIYEMHIGTFAGDATGDDPSPGTFAEAAKRLPYLRDLGINVIEIMPVAEFAGDFSWGYNPAHPFAVESAYGGPEGLVDFIRQAHEHGIAVVVDVVYNHFGPDDLSLWRFDGWHEGDYGGIYFYNDIRASTPWGESRPDYGRPEVRDYLRDNARMWLEEFGADGLRWDMSLYVRTRQGKPSDAEDWLHDGWSLMQDINRELHEAFPGRIFIAEDLQHESAITQPIEAGGAGFDAQWCASFVHPIRSALIDDLSAEDRLGAIRDALEHRFDDDAFNRIVYTESHDEVANGSARVPHEISPDSAGDWLPRKQALLGAIFVMTAPGVPMLFQGQEFLEDGWVRDHVPLDWKKLERFPGIHRCVQDLIALRRNAHGHTAGLAGQHIAVHHLDERHQVIGFRRWREGGDDVLVLVNLGAAPARAVTCGVPEAGVWRVRFNSDARCYSDDFGDELTVDATSSAEPCDGLPHRITVNLGARAGIVLSRDPAAS